MAEVTEFDIANLPFGYAVEAAMDLLGMSRPEANEYVLIVKGIIKGDTYEISEGIPGEFEATQNQ